MIRLKGRTCEAWVGLFNKINQNVVQDKTNLTRFPDYFFLIFT